jgi:hypothetical protein
MDSPEPTDTKPQVDRRRQALIESLQLRFSQACQRRDASAKQALFKEAVYLGIQPTLLFPPTATASESEVEAEAEAEVEALSDDPTQGVTLI